MIGKVFENAILKVDENRLLTRDHNFKGKIKCPEIAFKGATPTRDLNSFEHFSGPINETLRITLCYVILYVLKIKAIKKS